MAVPARKPARLLFLLCLLSFCCTTALSADARFDLVGPRIDVRVTRDGVTLPIAAVPNLKPGDRLWIHPDLPPTQSVKYLLICVFLRGTTNPPPPEWFTRIETWDKHVREEGTFITVPAEAQQALLFMAPETGGDFGTLKSAVQGRPGAFVRAQQDLNEAGFEQARIERYIADIRRVPPSDTAELQKHSELLARTLALKPNADCFKRPPDTQFTCLTQSGTQIVLDDGHGQTLVNALSSGPGSDLINQASYTQAAGGGVYSAYVGAVVDLFRLMGTLHTAQYQYIPAISFPQGEQMNLRLNTPPSFHNPKSVLVIALPAIQAAVTPPLRSADANHVACLIEPSVTLPIEGAPLVFSTDFAHEIVLHLNTPPGAPTEPDIPLTPDAYFGGLVLQQTPQHHVPLRDPLIADTTHEGTSSGYPEPSGSGFITAQKDKGTFAPEPVTLTGTIRGRWGFDTFTGPTVPLQQLPGSNWHIVTSEGPATGLQDLIAGHTTRLMLASTGTACVHTITAQPAGHKTEIAIQFKQEPLPTAMAAVTAPTGKPNVTTAEPTATTDPSAALKQVVVLTLPLDHDIPPGDLHLAIQQYDQPKPDEVATRTFSEPATVTSVDLHAADKTITLNGKHLNEIDHLTLGDLVFTPAQSSDENNDAEPDTLRLALPANAPAPPTRADERLTAKITLRDGRTIPVSVLVASARPSLTLIGKSLQPSSNGAAAAIQLPNSDDLPLNQTLNFTLKSPVPFPRNGQLEIETLDGTLRTVLTLAPSGGLLMQDPHTIVATLDPLRSFGPSAFGALHLRAVFPATPSKPSKDVSSRPETQSAAAERPASPADTENTSDWLPLGTLVRLPTLSQLQCPTDDTQPCTLTGNNLFLVEAVSPDPTFTNPVPVPDGYTGTTLSVPRITANTLFLRLRDDPTPIDSAIFTAPPPPVRIHHNAMKSAAAALSPSTTAPTPATPTDAPQTNAAPKQTGPAASPGPSANPTSSQVVKPTPQ
jgi:hypothetical protein